MNNSHPIRSTELPDTLMLFVWRYLKAHKFSIAGMIFVGIVWAVEMALNPYFLKKIIDSALLTGGDSTSLFSPVGFYSALFVGMTTIGVLVTNLYMVINLKLFPKLKAEIVADMHQYLINHSYSFFQNNFAGGLSKKIFDMSSNFEQLIRIPNEQFFSGTLRLIVSSALLFYVVNPVFSAILILWSVLFVSITYLLSKNTKNYSKQLSEADVGVGSVLSDSIMNIMSIKLFSGAQNELDKLSGKLDHLVDQDKRLRFDTVKINTIQGIGVVLLIGSMLVSLDYFRAKNQISVGDFALVVMLITSFIQAIYMIGRQIVEYYKIVGICTQSLSIIVEPHELIDSPDAHDLIISKAKIEFNKIDFTYHKGDPVFKNLNLLIDSGQKVGLVGLSGGGKSTLVKILLRLYDVQSGSILIDNQDIKHVKMNSLRNQIATIPQEPELFHRSILENIRFAKPSASDEDVVNAAKKANCHQFISELPQGYASLVGERGIKLSGGQRQRIAIARAVLKNAPILILDEATSALDSLTEQYIQEGLDEAMKEKTVLVIAHRLSTLKSMDRILVFEHGVVIEDGAPAALLSVPNGKFFQLWKMQSEGFINIFEQKD